MYRANSREWAVKWLIGVLIAMVLLMLAVKGFGIGIPDQKQQFQRSVDYVNDQNYDVMYYGVAIDLPEGLNIRRISYLTDNVFDDQRYNMSQYSGKMLIINDPNGSLNITPDQWGLVHSLYENKDYIVVYLGTDQFSNMELAGFDHINNTSAKSVIYSGNMIDTGFADSREYLPYRIEKELTDEQIPVYSAIAAIGMREIYFNMNR